jgi:hypothetical protein
MSIYSCQRDTVVGIQNSRTVLYVLIFNVVQSLKRKEFMHLLGIHIKHKIQVFEHNSEEKALI